MSLNRRGVNNPFFGRTLTSEQKSRLKIVAVNRNENPNPGYSCTIIDLFTSSVISCDSVRQAGLNLSNLVGKTIRHQILLKYNNCVLLQRFIILIDDSVVCVNRPLQITSKSNDRRTSITLIPDSPIRIGTYIITSLNFQSASSAARFLGMK